MIALLGEIASAMALRALRVLGPRARRTPPFHTVLQHAVQDLGVVQIRLRAFERSGGIQDLDDSPLRPGAAGIDRTRKEV